ncbi:alpha-L-fucosidase [Pedobacter frigoris]|uniref:alpha-L-fucosidase n=1 Tax=Pedobacter frigoris TaxID=2571272 RepID=UPI00292F84D3|nr:alpha-L-fucosidase [Pedobacter frigoris]
MFRYIFTFLISSFFCSAVFAQMQQRPVPNAQQLAWQKAELGVVFHYDLHIFDLSKYVQSKNRSIPVYDYNIFNPKQLDMEQWVRSAKAAGARFAILTATHETGFALFQSDYNPYSLKAVKWRDGKGDLVKEFVDACRKHDIEPGIYLGIRWNSFFGVHDFKVNGTGEMQKERQKYYNAMVEGMVKEICTKYGELFEIWFDGGASSPEKGAPDVLPIVKKYQPNALFYHNEQLAEARWGGSESGTVGYPCWSTFPYPATGAGESTGKNISANGYALLKNGDPNGKYWVPAMSDAPLRGDNNRHEWFWEPGDENTVFPLEKLVDMYYKSVGRNSTLILGLTPDNTGLMPEGDVKRLAEFGNEINRRFHTPLADVKGTGKITTINLAKESDVNHISIGEDISKGERIRKYKIEARINNRWKPICEGTSVGNKRIQMFENVKTKAIRLIVEESIAEPIIDSFKVFNVQ